MPGLKVCSSRDSSVFQETSAEMVVSLDCGVLKLILRKLHSSSTAIRGGEDELVEKA